MRGQMAYNPACVEIARTRRSCLSRRDPHCLTLHNGQVLPGLDEGGPSSGVDGAIHASSEDTSLVGCVDDRLAPELDHTPRPDRQTTEPNRVGGEPTNATSHRLILLSYYQG